MDYHVETVASVLAGCSVALVLAKLAINRALSDLDLLYDKVMQITEILSATSVRLEKLVDHEEMLKDHAKKIAYFEGLNGIDRRQMRN